MCAHVASVAHAKQHRAGGAVLVFVHFTGRADDESTGRDRDGFGRRPHGAAAGKAEIDFGGLRVAMIGTDLSGLPAGNGDIAIGDFAKDLLDVMPGSHCCSRSRLKTCMAVPLPWKPALT